MASSSSSATLKPAVGILSIGDMGMGYAKLLRAHQYPVFTVATGRSQQTQDRIKAAKITSLPSDEALVIECDIILSIVPPRDAAVTARRVQEACKAVPKERKERKGGANLIYIDLNAISPRSVKSINSIFSPQDPPAPSITRRLSRSLSMKAEPQTLPITVLFYDGGIIGGPPSQQSDKSWKKPSVVLSGPQAFSFPDDLLSVMGGKFISDTIGSASTLKTCFAAFSKGLYAIATVSYTTAQSAGVLPELQSHLESLMPPIHGFVEKGLGDVPPKAYRWVDEMRQIGETLADEGDFGSGHGGQAMFGAAAEVYRLMADETSLGKETTGKRKRGTTAKEVAECMMEGMQQKRIKSNKDPKLELAWRGSWS